MKTAALILAVIVPAAWPAEDGGQRLEDPHDALQYLAGHLAADGAYEEGFLETVTYHIEHKDGETEDTPRGYHDIILRESPPPESGAGPDTEPYLDRFRVYFDGRISYYSTIPGFFIPYEDFLEGITEL